MGSPEIKLKVHQLRFETQIKKQAFGSKRSEIIDYIKNWQRTHPGETGAQTEAARYYKVTKSRIGQIVAKHEEETGELLRSKGLTLAELAENLLTHPRVLKELLRRGQISFGNEELDSSILHKQNYGQKRIDVSLLDIPRIKEELIKRQSVETIMRELTISKASRNKDILIALSTICKQVNIRDLRRITDVFNSLVKQGFHIARITDRIKTETRHYYFVHREEAEAILAYLKRDLT